MVNKYILVFLGGCLGAVIREILVLLIVSQQSGFPLAIFIGNITASFLLGLVTALAANPAIINPSVKTFLGTGIFGAMSTFSTFIWGTTVLWSRPDEQATATIYLILSIIIGFAVAELGLWLGRLVVRAFPQANRQSEA